MAMKQKDDVEQLINESVYRAMTINDDKSANLSNSSLLNPKRSFESRGLINVIASTMIVTFLLFVFLYIHVVYTSSYFTDSENKSNSKRSGISGLSDEDFSTWTTSYDLPIEIPLLELYPTTFNFSSPCPEGKFALVLYIETNITVFQNWMSKCGSQVAFFRMNGDPEVEDVDKIIKFVPNAQYIPIKANLYVSKTDDMLADPDFQSKVEFEGSIVNSLVISGYLTSPMLKAVLEIAPFVEELTIEGSQVCESLVRPPRMGKGFCEISWSELRTLKIYGTGDCVRTFEYVDMCWQMNRLENLEIKGSQINSVSVKYIEDIIDLYRVMDVQFQNNLCTPDILTTHEYICKDYSKTLF